ncbi:hypothetical protein PN419_14445 [Halorubrum ezzemoulense]|jgi:hypothetical protein|uniref:YapH protein n=1 Tax=Halorubrum salinarum TaxID=2739057 RepID=A0A7D3XWN8_9EURY|nr:MULTISPECIES: hypothetical protein [Halorubrum]TKX85153.1 hypothetical protein EXE43_15125 [Halorubrum sp. SS5]MDB9234679.1 hypothetical protein [Halorubrum ezzemoulense]MDB9250185.1 hypothetical protein [Halorubrum ezzemoulense]MDB9260437.1 hypothetical protein [Halorubrum ezzemoulense]MDB9263733.1 hypothetical protein [Halorubrum ezzemoulense]
MNGVITAIAVVKFVILFLGGGITYIAFKAYRRTGEDSLRVLGVGFGIITLGAILTGVANQFFSVGLALGVLINSLFVALGLAVIMYSLYIQK